MKADRLLKLAEYLRTVETKKFDLGGWGTVQADTLKIDCGTTGCAVGHACVSGLFRRQGLKANVGEVREDGVRQMEPTLQPRNGEWYWDWGAVEKFFDLNGLQADFLFTKEAYPTGRRGPRSVANRIESFVKRGGLPKSRKEVRV